MNTPNGATDLLSQETHTGPPLQLPKVGWDDDDEDDDTSTVDPPSQAIPPSKKHNSLHHNSSHSSVTLRSSRAELELQPIPEDMSMHGGPWPDFCIGYDYDVDRKKAYRYRMCGRFTFKSGCFLVVCFLVLFVGVIKLPFRGGGGAEDDVTNSATLTQQEQAQLYESVATTFHPLWYDRSRGWNGTAYLQAYEFCSGVAGRGDRVPCPFVAYCPLGVGYAPSGGVRDGWAPVLDKENEWVQIGPSQTCELYSNIYSETPRWGLTGSEEHLTRNILCCLKGKDFQMPQSTSSMHDKAQIKDEEEALTSDLIHRPPSLEDDEQGKISNESSGSSSQSTTNEKTDMSPQSTKHVVESKHQSTNNQESQSIPIEVSQISQADLQELLQFFEPLWFDRSYGWSGINISEAQNFCESKAGKRSICPYVAYCPEGPSSKITGGHSPEMKIEWAPMEEWNGFNWVGIGTDNSCLKVKDVSEFGIEEGVSVGDVAGNIMCCKGKVPELDGE